MYHILTQIIEKLSGLDYEVYMQENIFEPLEMTSTYIVDTTPVCCNYAKASRAYGYWKKNKKTIYQHDKHFINPMITGDGSIFSNVDDLAKWNYALYTNKLLSDSSIKEITFPHVQMKKGSKNYYGYGWSFRKTKWNTKVNHHTGHWVGFKSYMIRDLDKHHCIILLTNNSVKG